MHGREYVRFLPFYMETARQYLDYLDGNYRGHEQGRHLAQLTLNIQETLENSNA